VPTAEPRSIVLDSLRTLGALAVVMLHVCSVQLLQGGYDPTSTVVATLCGWAVPYFFFLSGYLHAATSRGSSASWRLRRTARIALPYLAWSCVYVVATTFAAYRSGSPLPTWSPWKLLFFAQANTTLWFLPVVLYCGLALSLTRRRTIALGLAVFGVALDIGLTAAGTSIPSNPVITHAGQALAAYAIAYSIGLSGTRPSTNTARLMAVAALLLLGASAAGALLASPGVVVGTRAPTLVSAVAYRAQWVAGGLAFGWGLAQLRPGALDRLAPWGRYALGVYASHTLFALAIASLVAPPSRAPTLWIVPVWLVTSTISFGISWVLARPRLTEPLVV
jgi:fucose 4-O-acetylase-like acetyltransferase